MAERTGERLHTNGHIEVITGEMFSGKSEELIRRIRRAEIAHQKVQVFKPALDNRRGESTVNTNDGRCYPAISVGEAEEILTLVGVDTNVVAIDESQFFDDGLRKVCKRLAANGKRVIVAGLDKDFKGDPFGPMPSLLAEAEEVTKLHAICVVCGGEASLPQRMVNGQPANYSDPIVLIGGTESYEARCRHCHELPGGP